MTNQYAESETHLVAPRLSVFHILVTVVNASMMAASYTTRETAMATAVDWVEGEAETRLLGSPEVRYKEARRFVEGQGGQMEIIVSLIWGEIRPYSDAAAPPCVPSKQTVVVNQYTA